MLTLHNFSSRRQSFAVDPKTDNSGLLVDVFDENHSRSESGMHEITLKPYGHRWYRVGAPTTRLTERAFSQPAQGDSRRIIP